MWRLTKEPHCYDKDWGETRNDEFRTRAQKIQELQQLLFGKLTTTQQVRLWTNLDEHEQVDLINKITKDEDKAK